MKLSELNQLSRKDLMERLRDCCGSSRWVVEMAERKPYRNEEAYYDAGERAADAMGPDDWREAFSQHPRLGDVESLRERFGERAGDWSEGEQSGLAGADDEVLERLAEGNEAYEERFGHRFVFCATEQTAEDMLAALNTRLGNTPALEIEAAAEEQRKITRLRLEKLLDD